MTNTQLLNKSIVAGILIGIGVIINLILGIPLAGACLFAFGLLIIIQLSLPLYTGKIGFINKIITKKDLSIILIGNLIGITICISLYAIANPAFGAIIATAATAKFSKSILQMLIYGIFCGGLIHFAVKAKTQLTTVMAIMIFILIGAEHCIASFPFLLFDLNLINIIKFIMIIIGNSIGAIIIERKISYE